MINFYEDIDFFFKLAEKVLSFQEIDAEFFESVDITSGVVFDLEDFSVTSLTDLLDYCEIVD